MPENFSTLALVGGAMLTAVMAAVMATLGMAGAVHIAARREQGFLHLIFYAILLTVALSSLLSGRDLTSTPLLEEQITPVLRHPLMRLLQPAISLLILAFSAERILTHWLRHDRSQAPLLLRVTLLVFWASTVAAPALYGAYPQISHDYVYALVIGLAATLASAHERDLSLKAARNALQIFMAAGLLWVLIKPGMVMDRAYTQGFLPGLPRLAGLSPHAVSMGLLAQLGLLCLLARPFERRWLNRLAWAVGLLTLLLAQSKTAWLAFLLCTGAVLMVQHGPAALRRMSDPLHPTLGVATLTGFMLAVLALSGLLMFGDLDARISRFFSTPEGAQLASLTGRDRIWAVALDEWQRHPVFGHGPGMWDESFRASIGMSNATHGHNQFMDTLSRAGTVGALGLVLYAAVLTGMSLRFARATQGLSVGLLLALLLRSISEVPLLMFGYGAELIVHALLLMVLAAAAQEARTASASSTRWSAPAPTPSQNLAPSQTPAPAVPSGRAGHALARVQARP